MLEHKSPTCCVALIKKVLIHLSTRASFWVIMNCKNFGLKGPVRFALLLSGRSTQTILNRGETELYLEPARSRHNCSQ